MFEHAVQMINAIVTFFFGVVVICGGTGIIVGVLVILSSYFNDRQIKKNMDRRKQDVDGTDKKQVH